MTVIDMHCRSCKNISHVLWNGLCPECNPELKAHELAKVRGEKRRRELRFALRSRVLTDEEMKEVEAYDYYLFIDSGESFYPTEVKKEFESALLQQFRIRMAATGAK